jgi:hypothetical protein
VARFLFYFFEYYSIGVSIPTTHNNTNYSLLHPKNLNTVTSIPSKYYSITYDCRKEE